MAAIYSPGASLQMLQEHLRDRDPMINTAAFDAIGAHGKYRALEALLDVIDDTTEPTRLQALQLLLRAPDTDEAAVKRTLRAALKDPDPAFVAFAVETLAAGRDPEAENMLREALRDDNVLTRLLIVQSLGSSDAARPYLGYALSDPDKTVRKAAAALLNSSSPEETADR
jgi:HEAT repeat protein